MVRGVLHPFSQSQSCPVHFTWSSTSCIGESLVVAPLVKQILTSMSSVVGEGSRTLNHGGELKVQQELVGPHRGSLRI